ncbi:SAM-dependent methyltransferase [Bizionia myxarmorum]|uniref:SAM-dependent methyltransferase n=1 Tax=Bizionia myxarmorum TaxID=291186 RepID=A0A5D0RFA2_9FLAO|nr:SAM-dependent methyltransferase [Bizionia myxarmorum]TYB79646.1 SAM-dependent methyltransferase [Bizionia myxarmorum]
MTTKLGKLFLIPTTLGDTNPIDVLPITVKNTVENLDIFIVENEKTARRFIKQIAPEKKQEHLQLFLLNKHTEFMELPEFLKPCLEGKNVGLLSEAGCPAVADPGSDVVRIAHNNEIQVVPLVGPSSIIMAVMSSGMNGQSFAFNGYLPIDKSERKAELQRLERISFQQNQSQLFIETPYRNNAVLEDICKVLNPDTQVCVACDITLSTEFIKTKSVQEWKKNNEDLHKRPALFIIHKS